MPSYLNQNGNSIGSLLRFIQEQKSQSPIIPPTSEPGSPIRGVTQEPLSGSEGQGTSKVVSVRPEGTLTPTGQPIEQGAPQPSRVGPISIGGEDVGTVLPPGGISDTTQPGQISSPSTQRASSLVTQPPPIGTVLGATSPSVSQKNQVFNRAGQNITPLPPTPVDTNPYTGPEYGPTKADMQDAADYKQIAQADVGGKYAEKTPQNVQNFGAQFRASTGQTGKPASQITPTPTSKPKQVTPAPSAPTPQNPIQQIAQKIAPVVSKSPWQWLATKLFGW